MKYIYLIPLLIFIVAVSGCTSESVPDDGTGNGGTGGVGNFMLLISDAPADIGDFDSLVVHFSSARIFKQSEENGTAHLEQDMTGTSVDLTQVLDDDAISVFNIQLDEGTYSKIELYVESTDAVVGNETVEVQVPSNKLQIVRPFTITANETTEFVFDINVVKKGQKNEYNLQPVIGKSGVVGKDLEVKKNECTMDDDCDEGYGCTNGKCRQRQDQVVADDCTDNGVESIYECDDGSLKVVSNLLGGGYTIIKDGEIVVRCPVIAEPSQECQDYLDTCSDVDICAEEV